MKLLTIQKIFFLALLASAFIVFSKPPSVDASVGTRTLYVSPIPEYGSGYQLLDFPPGSRITSSPAGIDCPGTCSYEFDSGTVVNITYTAGSGFGLRGIGYDCQNYPGELSWGNYDTIYRGPTCTYTVNAPDGTGGNVDLSPQWVRDKHITNLSIEGPGTIRASYGAVTQDCTAPGCTITAPFNKLLTMKALSKDGVRFDGWSTNSNIYICAKSGTGVCYSGSALSTDTVPALAKFSSTSSSNPVQSTPNQNQPVDSSVSTNIGTVKLLDSEGNERSAAQESDNPVFANKEPITLSGKTIPNGIVKLYIFSEPQEATVTADDEGNWSYTIARIEPGDHRVEVEVTDPESGETSDRSEVLAFQVARADTFNEDNQDNSFSVVAESNAPKVLAAVGSVLAVLVLALLLVSKMHPIKYISHLIKH